MKTLIAKRLLELRGDDSREETAQAIGISVSALQMYENAQRVPKDEIKIRIANHFKKTVQEIFFDYELHETCTLERGTG
ncbi:putative transcriptional regulator [Paenibacillus sp. 4624]